MNAVQPLYQPPVNFQSKDAESYMGIGNPIEDYQPTVQIADDCYFHVGSRTCFNLNSITGFIKYFLGKIQVKYSFERLQSESCVIYDNYSSNYFHWFNDALPKYFFLQEKGHEPLVLLTVTLKDNLFISDSLRLLKIKYCFLKSNVIVPVKKLLLPSYTSSQGVQHPIYFNQVANKLRRTFTDVPNRKIFISRKHSPFRNLNPKKEVEEALVNLGVEILSLEEFSFAEQIDIFSECSHLIGVHGAGLTNMAFLPKGAKVMEIRRDGPDANLCYFFMAHTLGLPYYYFLGESNNGYSRLQEDNFQVNVSEFTAAVKQFIIN